MTSLPAMELALDCLWAVFVAHKCRPLSKAIQIGKTLADIKDVCTEEQWQAFLAKRCLVTHPEEYLELYDRREEITEKGHEAR